MSLRLALRRSPMPSKARMKAELEAELEARAAKAEAEVEARRKAALMEARKARDKAGVDAGVSALSDAIHSPMPLSDADVIGAQAPGQQRPTGRPNFNSRRKLADVGDNLKPALDTVSTGISGSNFDDDEYQVKVTQKK